MKKILLSILGIFFGLISFTSAGAFISDSDYCVLLTGYTNGDSPFNIDVDSAGIFMGGVYNPTNGDIQSSAFEVYTSPHTYPLWSWSSDDIYMIYLMPLSGVCPSGGGSSSPSDITVFYDYGHSSTSVTCNGDNSIYINGMSSLSGISTFTPFFNISYVDEDNQNLIESYNKDILYLQDGKFKKTYTGDNEWILSVQNQGGSTPDIIFTGDSLPVVVTGESDNVFSNFGDNALSVLYGNIPGFITGGVILFLIFFIIRLFIPKNKR